MIARLVASGRRGLMDQLEDATVVENDASATVANAAKKPKPPEAADARRRRQDAKVNAYLRKEHERTKGITIDGF
jgi:hypothetical protein